MVSIDDRIRRTRNAVSIVSDDEGARTRTAVSWFPTMTIGPSARKAVSMVSECDIAADRPELAAGHARRRTSRWSRQESARVPGRRRRPGCCAPFGDRSSPSPSSLPTNDLRIARHFGHDRVCSPRSKPSISRVWSATKLASCSRLGQPVMAIPPILPVLTTATQTPMQRARLPCIELQNLFATLISGFSMTERSTFWQLEVERTGIALY